MLRAHSAGHGACLLSDSGAFATATSYNDDWCSLAFLVKGTLQPDRWYYIAGKDLFAVLPFAPARVWRRWLLVVGLGRRPTASRSIHIRTDLLHPVLLPPSCSGPLLFLQ